MNFMLNKVTCAFIMNDIQYRSHLCSFSHYFPPLSIYVPIFLSLSSTCAHAKYISSLEPLAVLSETDDLLLTCSHQSLIS